MPPALMSDEEGGASSGEEEIPYRAKGAAKKAAEPEVEAEEGDEDEDEEAEEEYIVEKILSHKAVKGQIHYEVKWLGYEKAKDRTWEPQENLEGAGEVLQEYWDSIGGRPEVGGKGGKKRGRKSTVSNLDSAASTPVSTTKRAKKEVEWSPPAGSWETEVAYVETVTETPDHKTGEHQRFAYLVWYNQKKSQHPLRQVYQKCPQKMLEYYESHLVFTPTEDELANGGDISMKAEA